MSKILFNQAIVRGALYHVSSNHREIDAAGTGYLDEIGCAVFHDHAGTHEQSHLD
ncbi:MAG: hypothetical protein NXH87_02185 [Rhodobiaceae bacterium]|nr:hypothetical protein [Rhodobiaceae bacterium]